MSRPCALNTSSRLAASLHQSTPLPSHHHLYLCALNRLLCPNHPYMPPAPSLPISQRVLSSPELVSLILFELSIKQVAPLLRVSDLFFATGASQVWHTVNGVEPLLMLLMDHQPLPEITPSNPKPIVSKGVASKLLPHFDNLSGLFAKVLLQGRIGAVRPVSTVYTGIDLALGPPCRLLQMEASAAPASASPRCATPQDASCRALG
jgi:hypothetical protein